MIQIDFISGPVYPKPFRKIRNMRPSASEQKAVLVLELHGLCLKVPESIKSASIGKTQEWMKLQKWACAIAAHSRSSIPDLERAIRSLRAYG